MGPQIKVNAPAHIQVGSDCAGYGSEILALHDVLGVGQDLTLKFYSDIDEQKRKMIELTHEFCGIAPPAKRFRYRDIADRDNATAPTCDLYVAGPPCPAFSTAGLRRGIKDLRGKVTFHCLDYVRVQRPRAVVIENVKGLASKKHKHVLETIVECLRSLQYKVHTRVLNAADYGVPQRRERLFIVAIRDMKRQFKWPKKCALEPDALAKFLDLANVGDMPPPAKLRVMAKKIPGGVASLARSWYVVDLNSSPGWARVPKPGATPTLTRARCGAKEAYFVPKLGRYLTVREMAALQGLWPHLADKMVETLGRRAVGGAIGDAMSVQVLQRLFPRVLWSAGLADQLPHTP